MLDRDLTVQMHHGSFNHDRYNSFLFDTCAGGDQWYMKKNFSAVIKHTKRKSNKIYKTELTKIRYKIK